MKKFKVFAFVLIVLAIATKEVKAIPILNTNNNHWYERISYTADWFGANANAQTLSHNGMAGHLVTLTSAAETTWVIGNLTAIDGWLGGFQPVGSPEPAGGWQWVTGEAWDWTNWGIGEPNNLGNEGFLIFRNSAGQWNDWSNHVISGYIIEYEADPIPEPTTIILMGIGMIGLAGITIRRKLRLTGQPQ